MININKFSFRQTINTFLNNNRDAFKDVIPSLGDMVIVPNEYERIPLSDIMDGCLGSLGVFNKKHITRTFILKQGIWLTATEAKELVEHDAEGVLIDRLEIIRERLNLKEIEKLWINSKGLTFTQMRAMLQLKPNKKYGELTTAQLETLRYRILFNLEETVEEHITAWEQRMEQIEQIALLKQISLSRI